MQTKKPFAYGIKNKQIWFNYMLVLLATSMLMVSCSKNDTIEQKNLKLSNTLATTVGSSWQTIVGPSGSNTTGDIRKDGSNIYYVKNFHQNYSGSPSYPHIGSGNFFWNFADNDGADDTNYDINFTGIATGDIVAASPDSLKFIDKSFSSVVAIDWNSAVIPVNNTIGMDSVTVAPGGTVPPFVAAYANGKGWYDYYWTEHSLTPVAGRTLLFKRNSGDLWKIEVSDIYLNNVFKGSIAYYHFKYQKL